MGQVSLYRITRSPRPAVYHPGFPLAYDSCEHSWWYISRSGQSLVVRQAGPPTNVSAFPFALSPVRLFQSAAREVIDQRRGLDVSGLFNGQPVRYSCKTQDVFPLVDVSLRVKRSVLFFFLPYLLMSGTCRILL